MPSLDLKDAYFHVLIQSGQGLAVQDFEFLHGHHISYPILYTVNICYTCTGTMHNWVYVFIISRRAVGPGTGDIATPPVHLSVCPSIRLSVRPNIQGLGA